MLVVRARFPLLHIASPIHHEMLHFPRLPNTAEFTYMRQKSSSFLHVFEAGEKEEEEEEGDKKMEEYAYVYMSTGLSKEEKRTNTRSASVWRVNARVSEKICPFFLLSSFLHSFLKLGGKKNN